MTHKPLILTLIKPRCAQVTAQLFQPYWAQWCADTQALLAALPGALAAGSPGDDQLGLKLTLERWLLELKARLPSRAAPCDC